VPDGLRPLSAVLEAALYDPETGFYETGGRAGRRGDFLTSPEVGPLFGAVVAQALDRWWAAMDRPDPFVVVDAGAGPGTLARSVAAARPACWGAVRYVLVERAAAQRSLHPTGRPFQSLDQLPPGPIDGVILANELLDNLPFDLAVYDGGWREAWVRPDGTEVLVPFVDGTPPFLPVQAAHGARAPLQRHAVAWVADALGRLRRGRLVVFDYASTTTAMVQRPWRDWLRTYRGHDRGTHYLRDLGRQDVTCEVALDQIAVAAEPDTVRSQSQWLRYHGIDDLVEAGRRAWEQGAARGDLAALRGRSAIREADALLDPSGLGAFTVVEWTVDG
jgi:SAM-dependent MidA family methyltransferase